ncbi:MAG: DUF6470 family protein [Oscillospiraceae bacterium]
MQYLKITRVPIKITRSVEPLKIETVTPPRATMNLSVKPSKLNISATPTKLKMDNFESLSAMSGKKSAAGLSRDFAEEGMQAASEATGEYTDIGNQLANIGKKGASIPDIMRQKMNPDFIPTEINFVPPDGPNIDWEAGNLSMDYEPAVLTKEPQITPLEQKFTPSKINVNIEQYPEVKIEYVGDPIYVPPSANPNYEPTNAEKERDAKEAEKKAGK